MRGAANLGQHFGPSDRLAYPARAHRSRQHVSQFRGAFITVVLATVILKERVRSMLVCGAGRIFRCAGDAMALSSCRRARRRQHGWRRLRHHDRIHQRGRDNPDAPPHRQRDPGLDCVLFLVDLRPYWAYFATVFLARSEFD